MKIKTTWECSTRTEAERLLHCAHQIAVGFYRVNNFLVLPYNPKVNNVHIVTFPYLKYNQITRFWDKAKSLDIANFPIHIDKDLTNQTLKLLSDARLPSPNYEKVKRTWEKAQDDVLGEIYKIVPSKKGVIKKIIIKPTSFGTSSSFNVIGRDNNDGIIYIFLREDQGIRTIAESIVSSLLYLEVLNDLDGVWSEVELLVDWIVTHSSLASVIDKYEKIDNYTGTIKGIRTKQKANILKESEEFYKKLGIPSFNKPFSLNGLVPEINKKPVEDLSPKERLILKKLIEKSNSVISFDEIADEIFQGEDNFSLYAISKTIQRLRDKLEENGISGSYVQTLRGKGYLLKN